MSSHVPPLPINSAFNFLAFLYLLSRSTISNSFLFEGFKVLLNLTTLLSKKYNPVTAKLENSFLGFSTILMILFFLFTDATPYKFGFFTGCKKTLAPFLMATLFFKVFVKFFNNI